MLLRSKTNTWHELQQFWQLEEFIAIAALDEDVVPLGSMLFNCGFDFLCVVEFPKRTGDVLEIVPHEPYFIIASRFKIAHQQLVLLVAVGAELAHLSYDGHLMVCLHQTEVFKGCLHR